MYVRFDSQQQLEQLLAESLQRYKKAGPHQRDTSLRQMQASSESTKDGFAGGCGYENWASLQKTWRVPASHRGRYPMHLTHIYNAPEFLRRRVLESLYKDIYYSIYRRHSRNNGHICPGPDKYTNQVFVEWHHDLPTHDPYHPNEVGELPYYKLISTPLHALNLPSNIQETECLSDFIANATMDLVFLQKSDATTSIDVLDFYVTLNYGQGLLSLLPYQLTGWVMRFPKSRPNANDIEQAASIDSDYQSLAAAVNHIQILMQDVIPYRRNKPYIYVNGSYLFNKTNYKELMAERLRMRKRGTWAGEAKGASRISETHFCLLNNILASKAMDILADNTKPVMESRAGHTLETPQIVINQSPLFSYSLAEYDSRSHDTRISNHKSVSIERTNLLRDCQLNAPISTRSQFRKAIVRDQSCDLFQNKPYHDCFRPDNNFGFASLL